MGRGEDGAAGGLQAGQMGEGGELLGLGEQGGGAEAGFEDLEGGALTPDPAPGGSGLALPTSRKATRDTSACGT